MFNYFPNILGIFLLKVYTLKLRLKNTSRSKKPMDAGLYSGWPCLLAFEWTPEAEMGWVLESFIPLSTVRGVLSCSSHKPNQMEMSHYMANRPGTPILGWKSGFSGHFSESSLTWQHELMSRTCWVSPTESGMDISPGRNSLALSLPEIWICFFQSPHSVLGDLWIQWYSVCYFSKYFLYCKWQIVFISLGNRGPILIEWHK